ncbi:DNA adenine methylase [Acinetobacter bereziniae]|uniref:DNA adenine methylase n=1 Tax=Acinetobacter bereziniae TaxID=106648 RepID=UPI0021D2E9B4|nr:DNA adenine methylase [Acinetobacter bereziniae]MCU4599098.1 DNA adenine methylase [Acinetobacter bereziniae]
MTNMNHPLIRYHGGKFRIADWIISKFPVHKTYVEPFGGGASVLMCKPQSNIEVYNDIDSDVVNLFRVLRNTEQCEQLKQLVHLTPFSRDEFHLAYEETECPVEKARRMIVRAQMGFGSAGATKGHTGFRLAGGRQKNYEINLWDQYPQRIAKCAERLKQCVIENQDASKIISLYDADDTLFFVDPPYVRSTRTANVVAYRHEMTDSDHEILLDQLINVKGSVVITGYEHDIYNDKLSKWTKFTKSVQASGRLGGVTRQECLWISPKAQYRDLFGGQYE